MNDKACIVVFIISCNYCLILREINLFLLRILGLTGVVWIQCRVFLATHSLFHFPFQLSDRWRVPLPQGEASLCECGRMSITGSHVMALANDVPAIWAWHQSWYVTHPVLPLRCTHSSPPRVRAGVSSNISAHRERERGRWEQKRSVSAAQASV